MKPPQHVRAATPGEGVGWPCEGRARRSLVARNLSGKSGGYGCIMGVRGGASMRMGAAPPSPAPKSLLAVSGESESEVQLPRFDSPCMGGIFPRVRVR